MTGKVAGRLLLIAVVLYWLLPLVATALYSLATSWRIGAFPEGLTLDHWVETFREPDVLNALRRSLILAAVVVPLDIALVLPAAYWAVVKNPHIRTVIQALAVVPFALPYVVIAAGIQLTGGFLAPGLIGTFWILALATAAVSFPFIYWTTESAIASIDAKRLTEAAMTCGARPLQTLVRVILPSIKSGLVSGTLLVFSAAMGEFALAKVLVGSNYETLPLWTAKALLNRGGAQIDALAVMTMFGFGVTFAMTVTVMYLARGGGQVLAVGAGPTGQTGSSRR